MSTIAQLNDRIRGLTAEQSRLKLRIIELENAINEAIKIGQECQKVGCEVADEHILAELYSVKIHDEERQEKR